MSTTWILANSNWLGRHKVLYSRPRMSKGCWFQDPTPMPIPKSMDTQVLQFVVLHPQIQPTMDGVPLCTLVEKSPCTNRHISNLCCSRVSRTLLFVLTCHHSNSLAENHVILFITISWCPAQSQTQYKTVIMN